MLEGERARWLLWLPVALGTGIAAAVRAARRAAALGRLAGGRGWARAAWLWSIRAWRGAAARRRGAAAGAGRRAALGFALAQAAAACRGGADPRAGRASTRSRAGWSTWRRCRAASGVLLDGVALAGVAPEATPATIRVNLRRAPAGLRPGDRVRLRARLQPPMGPALPGGFDFARQAWFERLGAVGYRIGPAERLPGEAGGFALAIAELRARDRPAHRRRRTPARPGPWPRP